MALTTKAKERKAIPIATGFIDYFPDAIAEVAVLSRVGNDQHNPGKPLHWDRSKSGDESEALMRHFLERGTMDTDGIRHSAKVAWRAMAALQKEIEAERAKDEDVLTLAKMQGALSKVRTSPYGAYAAVARDTLGLYGGNPLGLYNIDKISPC
jgi:hypothetical protein